MIGFKGLETIWSEEMTDTLYFSAVCFEAGLCRPVLRWHRSALAAHSGVAVSSTNM